MYKVYWTEEVPAHSELQIQVWLEVTGEPLDPNAVEALTHARLFSSLDLNDALAFAEELRMKRRAGAKYSFISLVAEDPNSVGEAGVSDKLPEGYDWTKQDRAGKPRRR